MEANTAGEKHELSQIQEKVLEITKLVVKVLDEHHITYYMQGGTFLGAIRHGGFIPWDDDVDLGIPREGYERFLKIIGDYLPPYMKLQTWYDRTPHHYYFSRVVDTRYKVRRTGSADEREEYIWLDIFPLDGMPKTAPARALHKVRLLVRRLRYHASSIRKVNINRPGRSAFEKFLIRFILKTGFGSRFRYKGELREIERLLTKYSIDDSDWVLNFMGQQSWRFVELMPKAWYGEGKPYAFEDITLNGPVDYENYMLQYFGPDYMTPPPEGDRNAHAAYLVEAEPEKE